MNTEQRSNRKRSSLPMRGINLSGLVLSLSICVLMLTGCASSPTAIAPNCPEPAPIPANLSESDLPDAQNFSKKVQNYLLRVQGFLEK